MNSDRRRRPATSTDEPLLLQKHLPPVNHKCHSESLVSVCMPCYNAASHVGAALDSVLAQTWPRVEIVAVNDGSTDRSGEVLDAYSKRGVKVIHQENRGQCAAANRALREASGDYIKFFDADDLLSPEFIERQMLRLDGKCNALASAEWGRFCDDDLATFRLNPQSVWRDMAATDWLVEAWQDARPMMQCALWLIPRQILERCGGWDEELSLINDFEFFARVLCHTEEILFTPGATLYYRSGLSGSLSGQTSRKAVESAFHSLTRGTSHLLERRNDAAARKSCANVLQDFIYTYYPAHPDLRKRLKARIAQLGGSDLSPDGPPNFQRLRRVVGWKIARRVERAASR
jgi:glycosyltransferase involved in cell wall biosynthesis